MKKTIIALLITFIAVLFLGINYQRASLYEAQEIEKANSEMLSKVSTLNDTINNSTKLGDFETTDKDLPPEIEITYPSKFQDVDTIETDKVELKFLDDNKVVKATMNNINIPTEEVRINTEGTYNIEIKDEADNKATLSFTIKFKKEESTSTTTKVTTMKTTPKTTTPKNQESNNEGNTTENSNEKTNIDDNASSDNNSTGEDSTQGNESDQEEQDHPVENIPEE